MSGGVADESGYRVAGGMLHEEKELRADFRAEALIEEAYCRLSAGILKLLKDLHGRLQQSGEFAPVVDAGPPYASTLDITTDFASFMAESSSIPNRSGSETWTKEERPSPDSLIIG